MSLSQTRSEARAVHGCILLQTLRPVMIPTSTNRLHDLAGYYIVAVVLFFIPAFGPALFTFGVIPVTLSQN